MEKLKEKHCLGRTDSTHWVFKPYWAFKANQQAPKRWSNFSLVLGKGANNQNGNLEIIIFEPFPNTKLKFDQRLEACWLAEKAQ